MELYFKKEECCGCGACVDVCQVHAVHMSRDEEGFPYPKVESSLCVCCGRCEAVCPVKNGSLSDEVCLSLGDPDYGAPSGNIISDEVCPSHGGMDCGMPSGNTVLGCCNKYIGAQAKDNIIRDTSSSGGVFTILSRYALDRNGVVFGAGYNSRMEVVHQEAANQEQLDTIKRTKYVQSNMQGIFLKAEQRLREGRWVLFCGTPCQAHALKLFLGREYDTLIIVDLVCYGVPSPGIWEDYVRYLEGRHHGKMTEFSFRDKRARDHGHTCAYIINGVEYAGSLFQDWFCKMYFKNYILRPSCYSCRFCTADRSSDFTIGDFWGIEKVRPDLDDGMGNSMVILHTEKAGKIWEQVQAEMEWFECRKEELLQPRLVEPTGMAKERGMFMTLYRLLPFMFFYRCQTILEKLYGVCVRENSHSRVKLARKEAAERDQEYEDMIDETADICTIEDEASKERITFWKSRRRYILDIKCGYGGKMPQVCRELYRIYKIGKDILWHSLDNTWVIKELYPVYLEYIRRCKRLFGYVVVEKVVYSVQCKTKMISLTFDDGYEYTTDILKKLEQYQTKATFFLTGDWMEKNPKLCRRISEAGHEIGNHSYSHYDMTRLSQKDAYEEIKWGQYFIKNVAGKQCVLFRFPYGASNEALLQLVNKEGLKAVGWSVSSDDWTEIDAEKICENVMHSRNLKKGAIVLLHTTHYHTVEALDLLIPALKENGYQMVTVTDLLHDQ